MGNTSSLSEDEAPIIKAPVVASEVEPTKYQPRYRSHDAHHLEILVCRPFDSNEKPFDHCKIRYIKESRFFVFDMLKNSQEITFNHVIQCVKLSYLNGLMIGTNNGAYILEPYAATGLSPVKGLEGQNILDFDECFEYFLTADGNVFWRKKSGYDVAGAVRLPLEELGGHPITKMLCDTKGGYSNISNIFLINEQNDLIVRRVEDNSTKIIKLENDSPVVQLYYFGELFTVHKNGKVMLAYEVGRDTRKTYNKFKNLIANHNIVKMDSDYGLLFFQTGLLLSSLYDDRQAKCYDLRNVRVSDFQAEPLFTYVDTHGDVLLYNKYKNKIEFMDRGSGYFSFLANSNTKVIANHDCIIIYVTKDGRRRTEMMNMHKQATQTFTLIDVDIIALH